VEKKMFTTLKALEPASMISGSLQEMLIIELGIVNPIMAKTTAKTVITISKNLRVSKTLEDFFAP
jgi:hypothetical protein